MKKAIAASLALLILFSLCACANDEGASISQSSASSSSAQSDSESASGELSCPIIYSIKELLTLKFELIREYPCGDILKNEKENFLWMPPFDNEISVDVAYNGAVVSNEKAWASHLISVAVQPCYAYATYEPELTFLRKIDETHCYAVYNAEGGGRVYLFYAPSETNRLTTYKDYLQLYVTDRLSYADFSGIKVGDSIDKVVAIDRSAQQVQMNSGLSDGMKVSFHLLTDGLLTIKYESEGGLHVKEMTFSKDFIYDYFSLFDFTDEVIARLELNQMYQEQYRLARILPQDYPQ